jgi:hypothetical protein
MGDRSAVVCEGFRRAPPTFGAWSSPRRWPLHGPVWSGHRHGRASQAADLAQDRCEERPRHRHLGQLGHPRAGGRRGDRARQAAPERVGRRHVDPHTDNRAEAEAFIQNDPFTKVGRLTPASIADGERDRPLDKKAEGKGDDVEVEQGTRQHRSGSSQVANGCRPRAPDEPVPLNVRLGRSHFSAPAVPKASAWSWAAGHGNKSDRCS